MIGIPQSSPPNFVVFQCLNVSLGNWGTIPIGAPKIGKKDRGAISCPFIEALPHVPNSPAVYQERRR